MGKGSKKSGRVNPREEMTPPPNSRVKNLFYHLIFVSKAYIPNLGPLGPPILTRDTYPDGQSWKKCGNLGT